MKKQTTAVLLAAISVLLVVTLASCTLLLPEDGLPDRGAADNPPEVVYFGNYMQSNDDTPGPLPWFVLDNSGGELLLVSTQALRGMSYDASGSAWELSDIRDWLNGDFYSTAFSDAEKAALSGSDKVTLMTLTQAQNTVYFGNTEVRKATATLYAETYDSYTDGAYWLSDSVSGTVSAIDADGVITSIPSTDVCGVRAVIRINISDIALTLGTAVGGSGDGELIAVSAAASPYYLAVFDDTLPTLTVTGYTYDDIGLSFECTASSALTAEQKVYCYMRNLGSGSDYSGWAELDAGKVTFNIDIINESDRYEAHLAVVKPAFMYETYTVGVASSVDCVDAFSLSGIAEGDSFEFGSGIPFSAAIWFKDKDASGSGNCWIPLSWSAGAQSGTWSEEPFSGSLSPEATGDETLTVTYQYGSYDGDTGIFTPAEPDTFVTRSVTYHVAEALTLTASPADGAIFTGGRITITPSIEGGTWSFDSSLLSRDGYRFTGLAAGTTRITYTSGSQSAYVNVVITQSSLPDTGQNMIWVWALVVASACATALALRRCRFTGK